MIIPVPSAELPALPSAAMSRTEARTAAAVEAPSIPTAAHAGTARPGTTRPHPWSATAALSSKCPATSPARSCSGTTTAPTAGAGSAAAAARSTTTSSTAAAARSTTSSTAAATTATTAAARRATATQTSALSKLYGELGGRGRRRFISGQLAKRRSGAICANSSNGAKHCGATQ